MSKICGESILICWLIFLIYWFASALKVKAIAQRQSVASALAHRIPVFIGWFAMAFDKFPSPWNDSLTPQNDSARLIGAVICGCGLFICIWARQTLAGNWSTDVTFKENHELIQAGPYRFVRHPIYTGLLLMSIGTAVETSRMHIWLGPPLWFFGFWIKLKQEERMMLEHFPNQYPAYCKKVKALVPFVL